jgi:poly-gamma-glutamate capsule biosynthesis protein CapA/YwtB (metallophosphatase superfamily)
VRRRAITALALAAAFAGLAAAFLAVPRGTDASARPGPAAAAATPPGPGRLLRLDSTLPSWRAPGAKVTVSGWTDRSERLLLRTAAGRVLARTVSGTHGRFELRFRAPTPGRYRLRVVGSGRSVAAGSLLVRPLVLAAVGDVTFGEQVGPSVVAKGADYPWTGVGRTLRAADITVGNLETSISTRGIALVKQYTFRGPPQALPAMAQRAGFDVLTLANNHAADYGPEALLDTIRYVRAAGIAPIGAGANSSLARRPAMVEAGGLKVAFLGYSDVNPLGFPATEWTPGTARADAATIASDVRAARRRADLVVCFFHWGVELRPDPDSRQEQLASACLDAGARVVLGAHPHVFGPVTRPEARTLVAWTLGNFVFPSSGESARTAILEVRLDRAGVRAYRLLPVRIDGFRPQLVAAGEQSG